MKLEDDSEDPLPGNKISILKWFLYPYVQYNTIPNIQEMEKLCWPTDKKNKRCVYVCNAI